MNYWLDLFTGTTWKEFRDGGSNVSGFREKQRERSKKIQSGDVLLCYLTGVMRWVGALEVLGPSNDARNIWLGQDFPVRFDVRPLILLDPEFGVPMEALSGKVSFYTSAADKGKYQGIVRGSPNRFKNIDDALQILELLKDAERNPVRREVDLRKLARKPFFHAEQKKGKQTVETLVSVPGPDDVRVNSTKALQSDEESASIHTQIQYQLLSLGGDMGFDIWVAKNDRSKTFNGQCLGQLPEMVTELPTQFNEATTRTIELIDVLWLKGNSIVAAFEVESTTAVYSGLLRMSDLLALQPNLDIRLYLVAPDERREKVEREILRPTFKLREKPLHSICGFIPFSELMQKVTLIQQMGLATALKPEFLEQTAEFFGEDVEED